MRNARAHGDREYGITSGMDSWVAKLVSIIPAGVSSRREAFILENLNIKRYCMQKPVWNRWNTSVPRNWLHVAIDSNGDICKCGALCRDQHGRFIRALVRSMQKSSPVREFLQFMESSLCDARNFNVRHIVSSHERSFRFNNAQDRKVPWESIADARRLDAEHGPVDFHRVAASVNNAAICLVYCVSSNIDIFNIIDPPLAMRKCIWAYRMGLPVLDTDAPNDSRYPRGRAEDDGNLRSRRMYGFSDDMGIAI